MIRAPLWALPLTLLLGCLGGGSDNPPPEPAGAEARLAYNALCRSCHQLDGRGVPPAFPPLEGHIGKLAAADRAYLSRVSVYGLEGELNVGTAAYNGVMPPVMGTDKDIANAMNHAIHSWGNEAFLPEGFAPYTAEDVAAARAEKLTAARVRMGRPGVK